MLWLRLTGWHAQLKNHLDEALRERASLAAERDDLRLSLEVRRGSAAHGSTQCCTMLQCRRML